MKQFKNTGLTFLLMLLLFGSVLVFRTFSVSCMQSDKELTNQQIPFPEFIDQSAQIYLEIEVNNFVPGITEAHRLCSLLIHPTRVIPLNFDFRRVVFIPVKLNSISPISIFIKGHSLLN